MAFGLISRLRVTGGSQPLDETVVRLATALAVPFAVILTVLGIVSGRTDVLAQAVTPAVTGAFGLWMLTAGRPRALPHLLVSGATLIAYVGLTGGDTEPTAIVGLVAIGMTGSLFVQRNTGLYIAGVAGAILAATLWWQAATSMNMADRLLASVTPTLLFVFAGWLLLWLRTELESGRRRFQNLFDRAPVAIWEFDFAAVGSWLESLRRAGVTDLRSHLTEHPELIAEAGKLVKPFRANHMASELLEISGLPKAVTPLHPAGERGLRAAVATVLCALWEKENSLEFEAEIVIRSGARRVLRMRLAAPSSGGVPYLGTVMITATDISDLKKSEDALQQLMSSKDELVASVSHELRTPLTAVLGFAEELRDHITEFDDADVAAFVSAIASNGREVAHIVDDLLVAARSDVTELRLRLEPLDPYQEARAMLRAYNEEVTLDLAPDDGPRVIADEVRLRQILRNLLVNARRYGAGRVAIRIKAVGETVTIEVRDQGTPIPEAETERIFEPYYRSQQVSGVTASVGLGLTVSRQLARMMDGDLRYHHDSADSIFELTLPHAPTDSDAAEDDAAEDEAASATATDGRP